MPANANNKTDDIQKIVDYLNVVTAKKYRADNVQTAKLISARLAEGYTYEDFIYVIDNKSRTWGADDNMAQYIRPSTLFGNKFEAYRNEKKIKTQDELDDELEAIFDIGPKTQEEWDNEPLIVSIREYGEAKKRMTPEELAEQVIQHDL